MRMIIPGTPPLVETAEPPDPQLNACRSAQRTESRTSVVTSHTRALWKKYNLFKPGLIILKADQSFLCTLY